VHAITNWVTGGDVANALQALGARPVLAVSAEESAEITAQPMPCCSIWGHRQGPDRSHGPVRAPGQRTGQTGGLRPGGAGASRLREEACRGSWGTAADGYPGQSGEIGFLAGGRAIARDRCRCRSGRPGQGSPDSFPSDGAVVMASGKKDLLPMGIGFSPGRSASFDDPGHRSRLLLSAVIAAFMAVGEDPLAATAAGVTFFKLAGRLAGGRADGPGTFKVLLLDSFTR